MSVSVETILAALRQLPTTKLTHGEYADGKMALFADGEAVFRTRSFGIGQAYTDVVVAVFPLLETLLSGGDVAASAGAGAVLQREQPCIESSVETRVRAQIEAIVSIQPGMKEKASLFSKLVFSAVAPYLEGASGECDEVPAAPAPAPVASRTDLLSARATVVTEFLAWVAESGMLPFKDESSLDLAYEKWEQESNV